MENFSIVNSYAARSMVGTQPQSHRLVFSISSLEGCWLGKFTSFGMEEKSCSPKFKDPVELIDLRDLSSFRYNSGWQKYDVLEVDTLFFPTYAEVVDDETLKPAISINGTEIKITHTNLGEFLEGGLVGLIYGYHDLSNVTRKHCPFCASPMSSGDFLEEGEPIGLGFGIGDDIATFRNGGCRSRDVNKLGKVRLTWLMSRQYLCNQ